MRLFELTKTLNPPSISVGDEVKVGKWKNRKAEVKGFTKDDHGQPVLKTTKGDPEALLLILNVFTNTPEEAIRAITVPTLILAGEDDDDNGSHADLANLIPDAEHCEVPGGHMSCIVKAEFGDALVDWLSRTV